jgi:2-(3-amino-3-carboxypropyl)histidine synthase
MAKHSEKIGILISKKKGQRRLELANRVKEIVNKNGMKGYLIELDEFNPSLLRNFDFDSFVSTACPRIAIDDYLLYDKPILTWIEFEILVGKRKWSQYEFDQILA